MRNMDGLYPHRTGNGDIIEDAPLVSVAESVGSTAITRAQVVVEAVSTTHYDDRQTGADQFPCSD